MTPRLLAVGTLRVSLVTGTTPLTPCRPFTAPETRLLAKGKPFKFRGAGVAVTYLNGAQCVASTSFNVPTSKPVEWQLIDRARPLQVSIRPLPGRVAAMVCD